MCGWHNIEARSCNPCCGGKAVSIAYSERVYSLRYPTCNTHAPYCHLWPAPLYNMFPHYLINSTIFGKKKFIDHKMCVWIFSTMFIWKISHSKKNRARYDQKCMSVFIYSTRYSCTILMKLEFCRQILEKYSNIKFYENPSSGSWVVPCRGMEGWMDGRTDMTKLIFAFRKFTNTLKRDVISSLRIIVFRLILRSRLFVESCHVFSDLYWLFRLHFVRLLYVSIIDLLFMFRVTVIWKWCWLWTFV
jgi:hypothetical protein